MTSGNVSEEPIAYRDEDALARLGAIADLLLVHDRPIQTRTDDSVVRVVDAPDGPRRDAAEALARIRARKPAAALTALERPILACGAELKNTFCVAKGRRAWVSHHIGDLENYETLQLVHRGDRALEAAVRRRALGCRARPPSRVPVDQVRARPRRRAAGRRAASPRPPGRLPRRARRARQRRGRDLRRHRLRTRRDRLGRRAAGGRSAGLFPRRRAVARAASGRPARDPGTLANGLRLAVGRG